MGSLHDLLHVKTWVKYNMKHVLAWLIGIAEAIKHMHSFTVPVVHRDIKSGNILLFSRGCVAKLTDFGTSKQINCRMTMNTGTVRFLIILLWAGFYS